jgi:hypothetical protein
MHSSPFSALVAAGSPHSPPNEHQEAMQLVASEQSGECEHQFVLAAVVRPAEQCDQLRVAGLCPQVAAKLAWRLVRMVGQDVIHGLVPSR